MTVSSICFAALVPHLLLAQRCDKLAPQSGKEVFLDYLEKYPKEDLGQECVPFAIKSLASDRNDERAARVLVQYLDYYWKEPGCESISGGRCMGSPYPAMNSLMAIGDISQPYVLKALESNSNSQLVRENAVDVYYYFVREDTAQGVAALRWEADTAGDTNIRERLLWAASILAKKWCLPFDRKLHNCDEALAGKLPFNVAEDTRAVYEAVILKEPTPWPFEEYAIAKRTIVRRGPEKVLSACSSDPSEESSEYDSAIANFIVRNRTPELLGRVMRAQDKPYVLLDEARVAAYRKKLTKSTNIPLGYLAPDHQFGVSGPLIYVSRVGFSKRGSIAIVYVQHECPSTCAGGALHILRRHANFWVEEVKRNCQ